jgi:hypothetical protein
MFEAAVFCGINEKGSRSCLGQVAEEVVSGAGVDGVSFFLPLPPDSLL